MKSSKCLAKIAKNALVVSIKILKDVEINHEIRYLFTVIHYVIEIESYDY